MSTLEILEYRKQLEQKGYFILKLENVKALQKARALLNVELQKISGDPEITLEKYNNLEYSDADHLKLQYELSEFFKNHELGINVIQENIFAFQNIVAHDLDIQKRPYLRIARPNKTCDNIGYHRDTFYGGYPEELSIVVPFVDLPAEASLSIYPGSHTLPEKHFQFSQSQIETKDSFKKSFKHTLGFLYAPKQLLNPSSYDLKPIPLKVGEALVFMLSALHGSTENTSKISRWSSDIRIKNSLAKIDTSSRPDYYKPLCRSALSTCCSRYYENNPIENVKAITTK